MLISTCNTIFLIFNKNIEKPKLVQRFPLTFKILSVIKTDLDQLFLYRADYTKNMTFLVSTYCRPSLVTW